MPNDDLEWTKILLVSGALLFAFGIIVHRLRMPPFSGFVLTGVAIAILKPDIPVNPDHIALLAEIGFALLMLTSGLLVPWKRLWSPPLLPALTAYARVCGAIATALAIGFFSGWPFSSSVVFGLCLAPVSLVVVERLHADRKADPAVQLANDVATIEGIVALLAILLLASSSDRSHGVPAASPATAMVLAVLKASVYIVALVGVKRMLLPKARAWFGNGAISEPWHKDVVPSGLGLASAGTILLGVPLDVGAFLAGSALESDFRTQKARSIRRSLLNVVSGPFFIILGMQFSAETIAAAPGTFAIAVLFVTLGKPLLNWLTLTALGVRPVQAAISSSGIAHTGEFSWLLSLVAVSSGFLSADLQSLILNTAVLSILFTAVIFRRPR